jgi:hypothetical protein
MPLINAGRDTFETKLPKVISPTAHGMIALRSFCLLLRRRGLRRESPDDPRDLRFQGNTRREDLRG